MGYSVKLVDRITNETLQADSPHQMRGGIYLVCGTQYLWLSITYNYAQFFIKDDVLGKDGLMRINGLSGADSIPILEEATRSLKNNVSSNYWDETEGNAKRALIQLLAMAKIRPDGIWKVD